jgi:hypothetical protein
LFMPLLKWHVASFAVLQPRFDPRLDHVGFVVDKGLGQVLSKYTLVSPANSHGISSTTFINHPVIWRYIVSILTMWLMTNKSSLYQQWINIRANNICTIAKNTFGK